MLPSDFTTEQVERFLSRISISDDSKDCWIWRGTVDRNYGSISLNGKNHYCHRLMWKLIYGDIPNGYSVIQECKNTLCCNPLHLIINSIRNTPESFWERVFIIDNLDSCWEWRGGRSIGGYGIFVIGTRKVFAHRLSYELFYGNYSDKLKVLHKCDNPPCVRPDHLFLGTQGDNVKDMIEKGRQRYVARKGEDHGNAKLTWDKVSEIRRKYVSEESSTIKLSKEYNVSNSLIKQIIRNEIWKK